MGLFGMLPPTTPKPLKSSIGISTPPPVKARLEILEQQNEMLINEKGMLTVSLCWRAFLGAMDD